MEVKRSAIDLENDRDLDSRNLGRALCKTLPIHYKMWQFGQYTIN